MKKLFCLLLMALLPVFAGCGGEGSSAPSDEPAAEGEAAVLTLGEFTAPTLDGNTFANTDFADYALTMVNFWETTCGVCLNTMPYWAELETQLPADVCVVYVCADGAAEGEIASQIVADNGLSGPVPIAQDALADWISANVPAYPCTVFVNAQGEVVGDLIPGAPTSNQVDFYLTQIQQRLGA